jgi:predicted enzyme related to lactoylglutathione lyase
MNGIVHLELHTRDLTDARTLYTELCGWHAEQVEAAGRSYLTLELGGTLGGGIVECETPRPLWLPYVAVTDIDAATDSARNLGATVLLERREGPAGWRSVIRSPAGGELAFWQSKRGAPR